MTIKEIFDTLDYGPAPESAGEALAWIESHGGSFGHFIGGAFTKPGETFDTRNPANGETLAWVSQATAKDVDAAVSAARKAQAAWAKDSKARARVLYALARLVQKQSRLFAVLETLDNGKPIRESRDIDIPLVARHFYYHAGMAQLQESQLAGRVPLGVCGQIVPWNFPLLMLAWKVAPALAMGNTVVLKPAEYTSLTALLFADLCREAGVPDGVVNIVTGAGETGAALVGHDGLDKVAFTGSTAVGKQIQRRLAGTGRRLTLELGGKAANVVFEDAALDQAVEGIVDGIFFNQGHVCCAGSRLLVQESVAELVVERLKERMTTLRVGDPLDKNTDVGAINSRDQLEKIRSYLKVGRREGAALHEADGAAALPARGYWCRPCFFTDVQPSHTIAREEIFGPVLSVYVYEDEEYEATLELCDRSSMYALTGAIFANDRGAASVAIAKLEHAAGNFYINDKPTGAVVGQQPFGGARASGTNDKAGSAANLMRWVSTRTIKETFVPPTDFAYPFMDAE